jgi:hypothetical protein
MRFCYLCTSVSHRTFRFGNPASRVVARGRPPTPYGHAADETRSTCTGKEHNYLSPTTIGVYTHGLPTLAAYRNKFRAYMDKFAITVLQGISLSPIPTCSCAKGLAAGLRIVSTAWPDIVKPRPSTETSSVPLRQTISLSSPDRCHPATKEQPATPAAEARSPCVPDIDLAAEGLTGAREAHYMMLMGLPR